MILTKSRFSYGVLSKKEKNYIDSLIGQDYFEQLPIKLKKIIVIWNPERFKGLLCIALGIFLLIIFYFGYTLKYAGFLTVPYFSLPFISIVLIVIGTLVKYGFIQKE